MNISHDANSNVTNLRAWARRAIRLPALFHYGDLKLAGNIVDFGEGGLLLSLNEANYRQLALAEEKGRAGEVTISFEHVSVGTHYQLPAKIVRHFVSGVGLELQAHNTNAYCALIQISNQQGGGIEHSASNESHYQMLLRLCRTTLLDFLNQKKESLFDRVLTTLQIKVSFADSDHESGQLQEAIAVVEDRQQRIMNDLFMSLSKQLTLVYAQKQKVNCSIFEQSGDSPQTGSIFSSYPDSAGKRYQELLEAIQLKSQQINVENPCDITSLITPGRLFESFVQVIEPLAMSEEAAICFYQAFELSVLQDLESVYTAILKLIDSHLQ